jgi:hypothetical protein
VEVDTWVLSLISTYSLLVAWLSRVRVEGRLLVYSPGTRCREIVEIVRGLGIGEGLEVDCVMHSSSIIGVELRYTCVYGGTFRRVMSRPYPGGLLSIDLEALWRKNREMLMIRSMYEGIKQNKRQSLISWVAGNEV